MSKIWHNWYGYLFLAVLCLGITQVAAKVDHSRNNQDIVKIGIIQRFGETPNQEITLTAKSGDELRLEFLGDRGETETINTKEIKIGVNTLPIASQIEERLVVGNYRSFETAEDTAQNLRLKGIQTEIAQPNRWQVWAKRDVYESFVDRHQLLEELKNSGYPNAYLDTTRKSDEKIITWTVNGKKYQGKELIITANTNTIQVKNNDSQSINYPGILKLQPNVYGTFTLVNHVPVETYLRGVVPHEINAGAPYEANAAQAIIARTYLLKNLRRFAVDNYQLCADTQCQVYKGLTGTNPHTDRAIIDTKSQVLTYNQELIDALYSSTTGGVTASFNDVWNGTERPYLKQIIDGINLSWDLSQKNLINEDNVREFLALKNGFNESNWNTFRWRYVSKLEDITKFMNLFIERTKNPFGQIDSISELKIIDRSIGGRVLKLTVMTNKGEFDLYKDDIRSAFAAPRSTLFYLEPLYDQNQKLIGYTFIGGGLGHGVGLSQTGAYQLAKQGFNREQILQFYYPGTKLETRRIESLIAKK